MPLTQIQALPDNAIHQINSLGGLPLPTGVPASMLKVIMENRAAAQAGPSSYRIAIALVNRRY